MNKLRFSVLNLLLLAFAVATSVNACRYRSELVATQRRLATVEAELGQSRPIPFSDVRFQIKLATQDIASTDVDGIEYDPIRDQYSVQFAWRDRRTNQQIGTGIRFLPDGAGRYSGKIYSEPFASIQVDEDGDQFTVPYCVTIKDPLTRLNDIVVEAGREPLQDENWRTKR